MTAVSIYHLTDAREPDRIRYVGQTRGPLLRRLAEHAHGSKRVADWITSVRRANSDPCITLIETVPAASANEREGYWIAEHGGVKPDSNLLNIRSLNKYLGREVEDVDRNASTDDPDRERAVGQTSKGSGSHRQQRQHDLASDGDPGTGRPTLDLIPRTVGLRTFKVEDSLWDDCARIAADRGETVSAVIRRAMHVYALEHRRWP